jgi:hypothetical protein
LPVGGGSAGDNPHLRYWLGSPFDELSQSDRYLCIVAVRDHPAASRSVAEGRIAALGPVDSVV